MHPQTWFQFSPKEITVMIGLVAASAIVGFINGIREQIAISRRGKWWREGGWREGPPAND